MNRQRVGPNRPLPRGPVLGWDSFRGPRAARARSLDELPNSALTTSGRAAIAHALRELRLPAGSGVLVPTYHCPTMVAPIVLNGLRPMFFAIDPDGMPNLEALEATGLDGARALIVVHYFGIARSLAAVRAFCDRHGLALIEDCAHCFFGQAGERPVGAWGDYATGSLTKFFALPEAGLLASATRPIGLALARPGPVDELKGAADLLEQAARHRVLPGLNGVFDAAFGLKRALRRAGPATATVAGSDSPSPPVAPDPLGGCDMRRVDRDALSIAARLARTLPRGRIVERRRAHHALYAEGLGRTAGAWPLWPHAATVDPGPVPYVYPYWVRDADRVYAGLRACGAPVLRWDQRWPGTPRLANDVGGDWACHVLQFLCHQDLAPQDVQDVIAVTRRLLAAEPAPLVSCRSSARPVEPA